MANFKISLDAGDLSPENIRSGANILGVNGTMQQINVVQETGTSETDVMSQKAVTEALASAGGGGVTKKKLTKTLNGSFSITSGATASYINVSSVSGDVIENNYSILSPTYKDAKLYLLLRTSGVASIKILDTATNESAILSLSGGFNQDSIKIPVIRTGTEYRLAPSYTSFVGEVKMESLYVKENEYHPYAKYIVTFNLIENYNASATYRITARYLRVKKIEYIDGVLKETEFQSPKIEPIYGGLMWSINAEWYE